MHRLTAALFAAIAVATPLAACSASWGTDDDGRPGIAASGSGSERHWPVSGFDGVNVAASGDVEVRVGPGFSLTGTGDPAMLDAVKVTMEGHDLVIGRKRGVDWNHGGKLHFVVTMPRIARAGIGGSGSIAVDRIDNPGFEGNIGGSGRLTLGAMHVGKASFNIGGSGDIAAAGAANRLDVSIGGSGSIKAPSLAAQTASISIAGAGNVDATVRQTADVTIVGSGNVALHGGARCKVTKMGSGKVNCG